MSNLKLFLDYEWSKAKESVRNTFRQPSKRTDMLAQIIVILSIVFAITPNLPSNRWFIVIAIGGLYIILLIHKEIISGHWKNQPL